jgi:hypothetical protein
MSSKDAGYPLSTGITGNREVVLPRPSAGTGILPQRADSAAVLRPVRNGIRKRVNRQNTQEVRPFIRTFSTPSGETAYASRAPGESPSGVQAEPGSSSSHPGTDAPSLIELLEMALDEASWDSFSKGSAIRRAGRAGFARNVCVGLGNWGSPEAALVLTSALSDTEPLVRAHAAWALGRVGSAEARAALFIEVITGVRRSGQV